MSKINDYIYKKLDVLQCSNFDTSTAETVAIVLETMAMKVRNKQIKGFELKWQGDDVTGCTFKNLEISLPPKRSVKKKAISTVKVQKALGSSVVKLPKP